ncbi:MAG: hypothetical protein RLZZ142_1396, partial [Verrucomicrobiota bacterium]
MTFLNLALLGGTAAGTIPLLIHLLHRRRVKPLPWAAMHLLRQHPALQRRNPQLEHLLLLLLRVAIPVLLALAMAWPVLTANRSLTGSAPSSTLLLLDHSPSMAALSGGLSSLERAKSEAARILQNLPRGSEFALLPLDASEALLPPSVNTRPALHFLQAHQPSPHAARPTEALEAAAALLPQMHHPHKQVVLLSDFQKSNWPPHQAALRNRALEKLLALPAPPKITLFQVGAGTAQNLAIESLEFPKAPVGPGQPVRFVANLRNYSPQPASEIRVAWKVDGETRSETRLSIAPQSSAQTAFTHAFPSAGSHWVEVFTDADSLTLDNSLLASVPVQERVRVLLVSGRPSSEPLQGETDFLEVALNPGSDAHSLLTPAVVDIPSFLPKALQKTAVVVLANVRSLGPQQLRDLEEFVRQGGGLLVFPGNRLDAQWYNQHLHRQGEGLMPFALHALRSDSAFPHPPGIRLLRPEHPAFAPLQDAGFSLSGAAIRQWFSLQAPEPSRAAPEILATLENGDPFLVESAFGSGTVLTCASACN